MKKTLLSFAVLAFTFLSPSAFSQMVIDNTLTPQQLVGDVLLGEGVVATNIFFSGNSLQVGAFDATNSLFPIAEGLVMSSGSVLDIPAAGNVFASTGHGATQDPDLDLISSALTRDAVVLAFDFVPTGDSISFNYIFGSEEYPEFVNSGFNDVFAFIISGPGFNGPFSNGGVNIALIPGTATPVTIDNVNDNSNSQYYVNNANGGPNGIVFDGYTVTLRAEAQVQCGETYRIKLALADAGDNAYDSGVFIEARSFSSNSIQVEIATLSADSAIVEGCTNALVTFYRPDADTALAIPIHLSGSAINGVNFSGIPDTLLFLPGATQVSFEVEALDDGIFNPLQDTIIITVYTLNLCGDTAETVGVIFIKEDYNLEIDVSSVLVACGGLYGYSQITTEVGGGNPPYYYVWSNGETTPGINVAPPVETTYTLTVTDSCGAGNQTVSITVPASVAAPAPVLSTSLDVTLVCPGQTASLTAIAQAGSGTPPYTYQWSTGQSGSQIQVQPTDTTDYVVSLTDACYGGVIRDTIRVTVIPYTPLTMELQDYTVACPGNDLLVDVQINDGLAPIAVQWSNGLSGASNTLNPMEDETITVTAADFCGTTVTGDIVLTVAQYAPLAATIRDTIISASDTVTICELWADTLWVTANGGLAPYIYSWEGTLATMIGTGNDSVEIRVPFALSADSSVIEVYSVTVTDQCGVDTTVFVTVNIINCDIVQPSIFNPNSTHEGTMDFCGGRPQNNVFNLPCLELYPGNKVTIFDRWGRKTYEAENYHASPWDGGNSADGVYFYVAEVPGRADIIQGYFHMVH
ncbi:MAG: choice-of-anchor L domain-containing protein [Flavobacteriales bacterium]|nr:choice-of-anchor L domain-containing protein [Flavobacteriales bacterium]